MLLNNLIVLRAPSLHRGLCMLQCYGLCHLNLKHAMLYINQYECEQKNDKQRQRISLSVLGNEKNQINYVQTVGR